MNAIVSSEENSIRERKEDLQLICRCCNYIDSSRAVDINIFGGAIQLGFWETLLEATEGRRGECVCV